MGVTLIPSAKKQEYLKNIANFRRKKQRNWRIHTHKIDKYTQRMIAYRCFTPILKIFHSQDDSFTPTLKSYFTHKAVRIDVRVKISWHPHPAYPPLSTLNIAGLSAFTHTLRGIDLYWIPIFTEDAQELHRNPSNFLNFTQFLITMNENYKDFVTICILLFQIARSQEAEGRLRGSEGWIERNTVSILISMKHESLGVHMSNDRRPAPSLPGS